MYKILLAEDEAILRMLVTDTLQDEGYEVDVACDGEEAIGKLLRMDYDLVILDYMMPKMTGLDVIKQIRSTPDKDGLKILMLSAKSQQNEQQSILQAGANDFMPKPFSPVELVRKVGGMIHV